MYTGEDPLAPNWDGERRMLRSPLNGSRGPRFETFERDWNYHRPILAGYLAPYEDLPGADSSDPLFKVDWTDDAVFEPVLAQINARMTRGDVPLNLSGKCWQGYYGWRWPHGARNIVEPALVAGSCAVLMTGDAAWLELARSQLERLWDLSQADADRARVEERFPDRSAFRDLPPDWGAAKAGICPPTCATSTPGSGGPGCRRAWLPGWTGWRQTA